MRNEHMTCKDKELCLVLLPQVCQMKSTLKFYAYVMIFIQKRKYMKVQLMGSGLEKGFGFGEGRVPLLILQAVTITAQCRSA